MSQLESYKRETLAFLSTVMPFTGAVFYSVDDELNTSACRVHTGGSLSRHEHEMSTRYDAYFHRLDPLHPRRFADSVASVVNLRDVTDAQDHRRSEYYREFAAPVGLTHRIELFLRERGSIVGGISLLRDGARDDFTAGELAFLRRVRPLIECGFAGCRRSSPAGHEAFSEELSPREREIVDLVCCGASNREICFELHISLPTVKTHLSKIFRKTGVKSRAQLIAGCRVTSCHTAA